MEKKDLIFNNRIFWIIAGIAYVLVFVIVLLIADIGLLPVKFLARLPFYDIIGHFVLYGILSLILSEILIKKEIKFAYITMPFSILILTAFTVIEEISQVFMSNRTFSLYDMTASVTGIIVFYYVFRLLKAEYCR